MGASGSPEAAYGARPVMAGGGATICRGQKQQAVEAQRLKSRLNQRPRSTKGIKVDEIEPVALNNRAVQQQVCSLSREPV